MARTGDSLGYYYEEGFIEEDYFRYEPYIEAGYITEDYFTEEVTIQEASATISASAALSVSATRIQQGASSLTVAANATVTATRTRDNTASLAVSASQSTAAGKILEFAASFEGVFAPTITANALKNHTAILDSSFAAQIDAVKITSTDVTLENSVNLSLQAAITAGANAALASEFSVSADVTKQIEADASLSAAFNQSQVAGFLLTDSAALSLSASVLAIPRFADERPYNGVNSGLAFVSDTKQFGTHSVWASPSGTYATFTPRTGREFMPQADYGSPYEEMAIDLWIRGGNSDAFFLIADPNDANAIEIYLTTNSSSIPLLFANGGTPIRISGTALSGLAFEHIRILFEQIDTFTFNLALYQGGVRKGTATVSNWTAPTKSLLRIGDYFNNARGGRIDEFRILKSPTLFADNGWSISQTSITVPTAPFTNTEDTNILLHFDNNLFDDVATVFDVGANLSTAASLTAGLTGSQRTSANISAVATLNADVNNVKVAESSISASATVDAVANFTTNASANLQGAGGFAVSAEALIPGDFYAEVTATLDADVSRLPGLAGTTLNAAATLTADVDVLPGFRAVLSVAAAQTADGKLIKYLNWLPSRSVWHFDGPSGDAITSTGVTNTGLQVIDGSANQSGYGNPIYYTTASESHGGVAWFSGAGSKYAQIERTTGLYNTNIDTNNFVLDLYVKPYGDTTGFNTLINFHNSDNDFTFGYTYDQSFSNQERFNFIIQENGSDAYVYNYVVNTGSSEYFNDYYDPTPLQTKTTGWIWFRIQRINGNLNVYMRDIAVSGSATSVMSDTGYTTDFGCGYTIFGDSRTIPTRIDLVNLQIATDGYSLLTGSSLPNIQRFYSPEYQIGGELIARASLSTSSLLVKFGDIAASAAATLTVSADKIRNVVVNASAAAALTADADRIARTSSDIASAFTQDTTAVKTTDVDVTVDAAFTSSSDLNRVRLSAANLSSNFTLAAEPKITRTFDAALDSAFTQADTDYIRIRDADISTQAIASSLTVAVKVGDFFANADLRATMTVDARKTTDTPINLDVIADTNFVVIKAVEAESSISAAFEVSTEGFKIRAAEMIASAAATLEVDADVIRGGVANLNAAADTDITYTRVRYNTVDLNTAVTFTASGDRIRLGVVDISAVASVLATPFKVQQGEANLTAFVFNVTAGNILHLDPYRTLLVIEESRYLKILEERRNLVIEEETRVLTV